MLGRCRSDEREQEGVVGGLVTTLNKRGGHPVDAAEKGDGMAWCRKKRERGGLAAAWLLGLLFCIFFQRWGGYPRVGSHLSLPTMHSGSPYSAYVPTKHCLALPIAPLIEHQETVF